MVLAAILFSVAALIGMLMAGIRLRGAPHPPASLALVHGVFAVSGFGALGYAWMQSGSLPGLAEWAFGVFVLAALGGLTLLGAFHLRGRPLPVWMVIGHGAVALAGLGLLIASVAA
jgi:hypothetical protein